MSLGSTTKDLRSVVTVLKLSFVEISKALTKSSAFFESFMLKFAKMLDVAIVYPPCYDFIFKICHISGYLTRLSIVFLNKSE